MTSGSLEEYREKRDLDESPEPSGTEQPSRGARPRFVIQEHDATSHHYDFRLEIDGVLVSWAVPKGPSTDPREKRLAIRTEDHPLDYASFEGVIGKGQYGEGPVLLWDQGPFRNLRKDEDLSQCLEDGQIEVWLKGRKLQGGYSLHRMRNGDDDAQKWLLVKMTDDEADARRNPTSTEPESVESGRTIDEVQDQEDPDEGDDS